MRQAGRHLAAAGYAVDDVVPPDLDEIIETWLRIGSTDVLGMLAPLVEEHGDADARVSMRLWLELVPPTDMRACWRRWRSATSSCRGGSLLCSATRWW